MTSVRLLLDENLSPTVAHKLRVEGVDVVHVRDRGLLGATDAQVLEKAFTEDRVVVTSNVDDFVVLARSVELHCGLVLLENGDLIREEQEHLVRQAILSLAAEQREGRDLVNRILFMDISGKIEFDDIP